MTLEDTVVRHYGIGDVLGRIDAALKDNGLDPAHATIDDLKPVDELHTGGIEATTALLDQLDITPEMTVIDLGCGIGGTARHIVHRYGARVLGIDLTPEYVQVGRALNERLQLDERIELAVGSVLDLPYPDATADLVTLMHVGMNVEDKQRLLAEAARVLKPRGHFALFEVMRDENDEDLAMPLPWAMSAETSHVAAQGIYRRAAHAAGLRDTHERDRRQFALDFFDRARRRIVAEGPPRLGIHLVMGNDMTERLANYVANVQARRLTPVEMLFEKPAP